MRRALVMATFLLLFAPVLRAQRFHGIPPSLTSITPGRFGHSAFGGSIFVGGHVGFGHDPRFHVFFGQPFFFPHRRAFFRSQFFFPVIAPYPVYGYPPPYPYYDYGPPAYPIANTPEYTRDDSLAREIDRLRDEVDRLREERDQQQALRAPAPQYQQKPQYQQRPVVEPMTVLVFKDGHRVETNNYAIAGETLWVFSEQRARKMPLSDLDLQATRAANEERGLEFHKAR